MRVCTCVFADCFTERLSKFFQEGGGSLTFVAPFSELGKGKLLFSLLLIKTSHDSAAFRFWGRKKKKKKTSKDQKQSFSTQIFLLFKSFQPSCLSQTRDALDVDS